MATINCSECGGVVSTSAKACPHCGASAKVFKRTPVPPGTTPMSAKVALVIFIGMGVLAINGAMKGGGSGESSVAIKASAEPVTQSNNGVSVSAGSNSARFSAEELCKAAIALDFIRPVKIMQTVKSGNVPEVKYTREDGDSFLYRCRVNGNRIVWSTYFTETRSWGRWRDDNLDPVLTYKIEGDNLSVNSSETGITQTFSKNDF